MVDSLSKAPQPKISPNTNSQDTADEEISTWWRGLIGLAYISVGVLAVGAGLASISYRLTHVTVDSGLINGRAVRIQAPVDGTVHSFYARPGARVRAGQVLAQLMPLSLDNKAVLVADTVPTDQLSTQALEIRFTSAQQTLELLNQQLQELDRQEQIVEGSTLTIATETVGYADAAVTAAISQETAARNKYERFSQLLAQGAVSQQVVDEIEADWRSQQAAVQQARSEQSIARIEADALAQQAPLQSTLKDLQSQQRRLVEEIQQQTRQAELLALELQQRSPETAAVGQPVSDTASSLIPAADTALNSSLIPLVAPFEGVVHITHHDAGEQVNRPTALLSLLDCNVLWVETLVTADQANRIDTSKPVRIQYGDQSETLIGEVEFVTAISTSEITKARSEALIPAVSSHLAGQPLARIRVSMPPTQIQEEAYRFCGVGESAKLTFATQSNPLSFLDRLPRL
ncbi:MAG: HlyD family efflux transporter periplasmic adaptor subunit [Cyanobacteria bacterium P01_H01_bin.21]